MATIVTPAIAGAHLPHSPDAMEEVAPRTRGGDDRRWLTPVLLAIAALALLIPTLLVRYGPTVTPTRRAPRIAATQHRTFTPAEVPPVEPVALVDLTPEDARTFNAGVPFVAGPIPPARPFRFAGTAEDRARATDCLAAALIYEAGDDAGGERAVAQVVLNRVRHPAYPKTVCGVVFQGSERSTGCQFTFTCDGALTRWTPSEAGWQRAREVATAALGGKVDKRVGWATHYHTDWVVPYWQSSLDKIAKVGTHLFFRWTGWWGTAGAFRSPGAVTEPAITKLALLSEAHRPPGLVLDPAILAAAAATPAGDGPAPVTGDPNSFLVALPANTAADAYPLLATEACADRAQCRYSAWGQGYKPPTALPLTPEQVATMTFSYLRDRPAGIEKALWNCQQTQRSKRTECMKVQVLTVSTLPSIPTASPTGAPVPAPRGPIELGGVRRRATGTFAPAVPATPQPAATPAPRATAAPAARPTPSPTRPRAGVPLPLAKPPQTSPAAAP